MNHNWIDEENVPIEILNYFNSNEKFLNYKYKICNKCKLQILIFKNINYNCNTIQFITVIYNYYYLNNKPCENNATAYLVATVLWDELTCEEIIIKNLVE